MPLSAVVRIQVVTNWIDTGVVTEPKSFEYRVGPRYTLHDGEIRRTVADHGRSDRVLNRAFRPVSILSKFLLRQPKHGMMPIAMAANLVPKFQGFSYQLRKALSYPSQVEKGSAHVMSRE